LGTVEHLCSAVLLFDTTGGSDSMTKRDREEMLRRSEGLMQRFRGSFEALSEHAAYLDMQVTGWDMNKPDIDGFKQWLRDHITREGLMGG
jgi:hypothetical protein